MNERVENLRRLAQECARTSAGRSSIQPEDAEGAKKCLKALAKEAKLSKVPEVTGITPLDVPQGFSSMFTELRLKVEWYSTTSATVSWDYRIPGGGSNGIQIAWIGLSRDEEAWMYKLEGSTSWVKVI